MENVVAVVEVCLVSHFEGENLPSLCLDASGALTGLDEPLEAAFARMFEDLQGNSLADNDYFIGYIESARACTCDAWHIYAPLAYYFARARLWRRVCEVMELCLLQQTTSEQANTYGSWSAIGESCFGDSESFTLAERSSIWAERLEIEKRWLALDRDNACVWFALAMLYQQYPGPESERKRYLAEALKCFEQAQVVAAQIDDQEVLRMAKMFGDQLL